MNRCNNCGRSWHVYKQCRSPITSNGIININEEKKYMMICRKKSLGYVDFLRGKYTTHSSAHIINLLDEMTLQEKNDLLTKPFHELWEDLWGVHPDQGSDTNLAREKLALLIEGITIDGSRVTLAELIQSNTTSWTEPEWGFPKGRRNNYETDCMCALREYEEETGHSRQTFNLINNLMPYEEIFTGSNYKTYKHKYYVGFCDAEPAGPFQTSEVSAMKYFTYDEALEVIRPYNTERKQILAHVHAMLTVHFPDRDRFRKN